MRLTVIIPTREKELKPDNVTVRTLQAQTYRDFKVVVSPDQGHGANWARNQGFNLCDTELVLFSDDDINWDPSALEKMITCLDKNPHASYVYCSYQMGSKVYCNISFAPHILRGMNYISTMSILKSVDFIGFDEDIPRFQDWDLWLGLLMRGKVGVWCGECLFSTAIRNGITYGNPITPYRATDLIKRKYGL